MARPGITALMLMMSGCSGPDAASRSESPEFPNIVWITVEDPAIDNMRAVRDRRFKYIRNDMPERSYVQFLPYRDRMGFMQVLLEMDATGALQGPERLWFRKTKPM